MHFLFKNYLFVLRKLRRMRPSYGITSQKIEVRDNVKKHIICRVTGTQKLETSFLSPALTFLRCFPAPYPQLYNEEIEKEDSIDRDGTMGWQGGSRTRKLKQPHVIAKVTQLCGERRVHTGDRSFKICGCY